MNVRKERLKAWRRWQNQVARRKNGISCPEGPPKQQSLACQWWNVRQNYKPAGLYSRKVNK